MTTDQTGDGVLPPELEAIAAAAHDRLHAQAGQDLAAERRGAAARRRGGQRRDHGRGGAGRDRRSRAHRGAARPRRAGREVLKQVARTAKRKREADSEYEQAVTRAGRLGLSHREIAAAAQVSHGTVRAILTRATPSANGDQPQTAATDEPAATASSHSEPHSSLEGAGRLERARAPGAPSARRSSAPVRSGRAFSQSVKS